MKEYRVIYLDAFTRQPFWGNPCAVLTDAEGLTTAQMQAIARETNLPETAFVLSSDKADFRVRYFMPRMEIPFAGHPTIATAFMLAEEGMIDLTEPVTSLTLEFEIGVLPVYIEVKDGTAVNAEMVQKPPVFGSILEREIAAPCFNLEPGELVENAVPQIVGTGVNFLIVPVKNLDVLIKAQPQKEMLAKVLDELGVSAAFLCTAEGLDSVIDVQSRLIDPRGAFEDPFTGSAAGAMGSYMYHHGLLKTPVIRLAQGDNLGRPGRGILTLSGSPDDIKEVRLKGPAVKVMEGKFFV